MHIRSISYNYIITFCYIISYIYNMEKMTPLKNKLNN